MSKKSGIIYDLGAGRFGLVIHNEQNEIFNTKEKVLVRVFKDQLCTIPEKGHGDKDYVTLKDISKIKPIGYSD